MQREGLKEISWPQLALPGRSFTSLDVLLVPSESPGLLMIHGEKDIDATSQWEGGQRTCRLVANPLNDASGG